MAAMGCAKDAAHAASFWLRRRALAQAVQMDLGFEGSAPFVAVDSWLRSVKQELGSGGPKQVCEVGFNVGGSAAAWLCAYPEAHYLGFDLLRTNASLRAAAFMRAAFGARFELIVGNTLSTLPRHAARHPRSCDVLSVDGGHELAVAYSDLSYMRLLARERHALLMDDLRCSTWWCRPPTSVWQYLSAAGVVHEAGCTVDGCCTGWCAGRYNLSAPQPEPSGVCGVGGASKAAAAANHSRMPMLSKQSRYCLTKAAHFPTASSLDIVAAAPWGTAERTELPALSNHTQRPFAFWWRGEAVAAVAAAASALTLCIAVHRHRRRSVGTTQRLYTVRCSPICTSAGAPTVLAGRASRP